MQAPGGPQDDATRGFELGGWATHLRGANARFRGDISDGGTGRAILLEDPSGNIVELFEFKKR
jgi:catechol-2,3-dioxygenase